MRDPRMIADSLIRLLPMSGAGLEFIPENGGGAGIRFRERKA